MLTKLSSELIQLLCVLDNFNNIHPNGLTYMRVHSTYHDERFAAIKGKVQAFIPLVQELKQSLELMTEVTPKS